MILDRLEALAHATTRAPWRSVAASGTRAVADFEYIAAVSPDVVLKLIAVAYAAKTMRGMPTNVDPTPFYDALSTALDALEVEA